MMVRKLPMGGWFQVTELRMMFPEFVAGKDIEAA